MGGKKRCVRDFENAVDEIETHVKACSLITKWMYLPKSDDSYQNELRVLGAEMHVKDPVRWNVVQR